jgi:hypothetical protein
MKASSRAEAARPDDHPQRTVAPRAAGTTGLQAAGAILEAALDGVEKVMAPAEFVGSTCTGAASR